MLVTVHVVNCAKDRLKAIKLSKTGTDPSERVPERDGSVPSFADFMAKIPDFIGS